MNENNGITTCPKCGYKTTFASSFCPKCGTSIDRPKTQPAEPAKVIYHSYSPQSQTPTQEQQTQQQMPFQSSPQPNFQPQI